MVEYVLDHLAPIPDLDLVHLVTNHKFAPQFEAWSAALTPPPATPSPSASSTTARPTIPTSWAPSATSTSSSNANTIDDDLVVVAGDNLFSQPLTGFGEACRRHPGPRPRHLRRRQPRPREEIQPPGTRPPPADSWPSRKNPSSPPARSAASPSTSTPAPSCPSSANTSPKATTPTNPDASSNGCASEPPSTTWQVPRPLVRHRLPRNPRGSQSHLRPDMMPAPAASAPHPDVARPEEHTPR
jgi:hypothetical protein